MIRLSHVRAHLVQPSPTHLSTLLRALLLLPSSASTACLTWLSPPLAEEKPGLAQITLFKSFWILYQELTTSNRVSELMNELQQKTWLDVIL